VFRKVLIANRGEIALRVIRACRELGVASVAVYSEADARAPHVREADEAVLLGPAPSSESYLKGSAIIEAARRVGAEAIHPGYGFLSEREWFARAVREAGLVFVGPPAEAIAAMGSKTAARELAIAAGTPVVPGTTTALRDAADAEQVAERFGFPVRPRSARRATRSATTPCTSRSTSSGRATSRSRCWETSTARCSISESASARCSAAIRR
jgi:acetyl-CoA carboxylase, biotin carboxylase subunit